MVSDLLRSVAHIGDNLRNWAERLAEIARGGSTAIASYDDNELAVARNYEALSLPGVLWDIERSLTGHTSLS